MDHNKTPKDYEPSGELASIDDVFGIEAIATEFLAEASTVFVRRHECAIAEGPIIVFRTAVNEADPRLLPHVLVTVAYGNEDNILAQLSFNEDGSMPLDIEAGHVPGVMSALSELAESVDFQEKDKEAIRNILRVVSLFKDLPSSKEIHHAVDKTLVQSPNQALTNLIRSQVAQNSVFVSMTKGASFSWDEDHLVTITTQEIMGEMAPEALEQVIEIEVKYKDLVNHTICTYIKYQNECRKTIRSNLYDSESSPDYIEEELSIFARELNNGGPLKTDVETLLEAMIECVELLEKISQTVQEDDRLTGLN